MKTISKIAVLMMAMLVSNIDVMGQKQTIRIPYDCTYRHKEYPKNDIWKDAYYRSPEGYYTREYENYLNKFKINYRYDRDETFEYTITDTVFQDIVYRHTFLDGIDKILTIDGVKYKGTLSLPKYKAESPFEKKMTALRQDERTFKEEKDLFVHRYLKYEEKYLELKRKDAIRDSIAAIKRAEAAAKEAAQLAAREKAIAAERKKRIYATLNADISDPAKPLQTKTATNTLGAKVTYQYYVNDNGYEVKHGKCTVTMTFNNYKFWTGMSQYGWVYLNGSESCTYYYKNDIVHGRLTYSSNVSASATFGNDELLKNNISFDVYKGFINGDFKFTYKGITYTGKATNGILDYCNYDTVNGYHGKLTSNSAGKNISISEIDNGYSEFELDAITDFAGICCKIPMLYFPRTGK